MAGVIDTTGTFSNNDQVTSTKLNNLVDQSFFTNAGLDNTTIKLNGAGGTSGLMTVGTIASGNIATDAVQSINIKNGEVSVVKLSTGSPSWTSDGAFTTSGSTTGLSPITDAAAEVNIGSARTADGVSFIDFNSSFPVIDYDARISRESGENGNLVITNVGTGSLVLGTAPIPTPSGNAPVYGARAWVNFNGTTNANITGTYSRTGTVITIAGASNHGLIIGNRVFIDFTGGTGGLAFDGVYEVASVINVDSFTVTSSPSGTITAGTAVLNRKTIRGSGNVACISESPTSPIIPPTASQTKTAGCYIMNFSKDMPDENFAVYGSSNDGTLTNGGNNQFVNGSPVPTKTAFAYLACCDTSSTLSDMAFISATVIR